MLTRDFRRHEERTRHSPKPLLNQFLFPAPFAIARLDISLRRATLYSADPWLVTRPADLHATVAGCCASPKLDFSSLIESSLMNSSISGGILRVMAAQRERKVTKDHNSTDKVRSADAHRTLDEPVLRLARLIGRQIAREQFERQVSRERKLIRRKSSKPT